MALVKKYVRDSLSQRGSSWRLSYHAVYEDGTVGKRTFETISACPSKKCALAFWERRLIELSIEASTKSDKTPTLKQICTDIVEGLFSTKAIEERTYVSYRRDIRQLGELGDMEVSTIELDDVIKLIASLSSRFSPSTVKSTLKLIRRALKYAVKRGYITYNFAEEAKGPKAIETKPRALDDAERRDLVRLCENLSGFTPVAVRIALSTGLRRGEVCGLQWKHIDLKAKKLSVEQSIGQGIGGRNYVKEPKTKASRRTLPLESGLATMLMKRRDYHMKRCKQARITFSDELYVIGDIDGKYIDPNELGNRFVALARAFNIAGGECRFHWLRHTFATGLLTNGTDIRTVSGWLGHTDPGFTLRVYVDLDQGALIRSVDTIEQMLSPKPKSEPQCENLQVSSSLDALGIDSLINSLANNTLEKGDIAALLALASKVLMGKTE